MVVQLEDQEEWSNKQAGFQKQLPIKILRCHHSGIERKLANMQAHTYTTVLKPIGF